MLRRASSIALLFALAACGGDSGPDATGTRPRFDPAALDPARRDFFGLPFPTDLRRKGAGIDTAGFPNPERAQLLADYQGVLLADGPGFGAASAVYVSFSGALQGASVTADNVFAVDLDASGARTPLRLRYQQNPTLFLPANTISALPLYGVPFAAGHRHALVVTDGVKDAQGKAVVADAAMRRALEGAGEAAAVTAPFVAWARGAGFDLRRVALASVFTVADAAAGASGLRRAVQAAAAPAAAKLAFHSSNSSRHLFTAEVPIPVFQEGAAPYLASGGRIFFEADGSARLQRTENVRIGISIPRGAPPAAGFPTVLYAHGTGGWYLSFACEGIDSLLAARGIAVIGIEQVAHGPRNPICKDPGPSTRNPLCQAADEAYDQCVGTAYFNLLNPWAGRDTTRQGAADLFQLIRAVPGLTVPASLHPESREARFDAARVAFLGHSQGGLTGAPFVAAEPGLRAAVVSGTGGTLAITVLERKDPVDLKALAETLLGIQGKEPLDPFHPILTIVQTIAEPADPLSYAPHLVRDPIGGTSRHVMLTEGVLDAFTPAETSEALGTAAFFDIGGTASRQSAGFTARGLRVLPLPAQENVDTPSGKKTGVLLQYPADGHFAIFNNPVAKCRYLTFIETALASGVARVDPCGG